ncbi:MAG: hypothetical protein R2836_06375 [Chitinophagales bacterium]
MKKAFLIILLLSISNVAISQNNGVVGKRGVIKTDLVNYVYGKNANIVFEYALTKHLSIDFEYKFLKRKMKPIYDNFFADATGDYYNTTYGVIEGEKFDVTSHFFMTSFRLYNQNKFNAPKGRFMYAKIGYGIAQVEGYYPEEVENIWGEYETEYFRFREKGIHYLPIELGLGKQWIFGQYVAFEVSAGYFISPNINYGGVTYSEGVSARISPGLIPLSGRYLLRDYYQGLSHGFSFTIRLGIMTPF